jgi:hypothetical protein
MGGLLGCSRTETDTTFVYGETDALKKSGDAIASGNVAVLIIDSSGIPGQKTGSVNIANHWVVLLSVENYGTKNSLRILSWQRVLLEYEQGRVRGFYVGRCDRLLLMSTKKVRKKSGSHGFRIRKTRSSNLSNSYLSSRRSSGDAGKQGICWALISPRVYIRSFDISR